MTKFRTKPETRQVLCGSVRNILFSSSPGLTFGVCATTCFLLLHKMSQYSNMPDYLFFKPLLNIIPLSSLWSRTSTKTFWQLTLMTTPQKSPLLFQDVKGSLLMLMHHLPLPTKSKMPRVAFSCQPCPSEQGVTGCLIQHFQPQERGDSFRAGNSLHSCRTQEAQGTKASSCGSKFGYIGPLLLMYIRPENQIQEIVHMQKDSWS